MSIPAPFAPDRFEDGPPMLLAGLRQRHAFTDGPEGMARQWAQFTAQGGLAGHEGEATYGVMCGHDDTSIEYMTGVEVPSFDGLPADVGRMRVPAQHYAVFRHDAPATALRETWARILGWLETGPYRSAHRPDFERYGPEFNPATGASDVEVWVGVVPHPTPVV